MFQFKTSGQRVHTIRVRDKEIHFDVQAPAGRRFFLPRYKGGKLHEAAATQYIVEALTPQSVFLDVGSNLGYFSIVAAHFAKTVYAVEAQDKMVSLVRANAALNELDNVHAFCAAAGDKPGFADIPVDGKPGTALNSATGNKVPIIRLDDYFADGPLPDVMKIDVEGFELNVLKGASRLLAHGPALAIELHETMADFGATPQEVLTILFDHGYRVRAGQHRSQELSLSEVNKGNLRRISNAMIFCDKP